MITVYALCGVTSLIFISGFIPGRSDMHPHKHKLVPVHGISALLRSYTPQHQYSKGTHTLSGYSP